MNLQNRIDLFVQLGNYLQSKPKEWLAVRKEASIKNPWFTEPFIDMAVENIVQQFLQRPLLHAWANHYHLDDNINPKKVGIVMAGNIPLVGFHDFLSVFISGHHQVIKLSEKDDVLLKHIIAFLQQQNDEIERLVSLAPLLKGCDAYIATGGNQSATHFEYYFAKYPHIIRRNRTSAAILDGSETTAELEKLSDDIHSYFGMGCRNVTKIYVPKNYDFKPLLQSFHRYTNFRDYHKYANNYDFQLSLLLLNNQYYMTNENTLLAANENLFSPISVLFYEFYDDKAMLEEKLKNNEQVQCITGHGNIEFGQAQVPGLFTYADGVDTMQFLLGL